MARLFRKKGKSLNTKGGLRTWVGLSILDGPFTGEHFLLQGEWMMEGSLDEGSLHPSRKPELPRSPQAVPGAIHTRWLLHPESFTLGQAGSPVCQRRNRQELPGSTPAGPLTTSFLLTPQGPPRAGSRPHRAICLNHHPPPSQKSRAGSDISTVTGWQPRSFAFLPFTLPKRKRALLTNLHT